MTYIHESGHSYQALETAFDKVAPPVHFPLLLPCVYANQGRFLFYCTVCCVTSICFTDT